MDSLPRYSVSALASAIKYTNCKKHFHQLASGKQQHFNDTNGGMSSSKKADESIKYAHCDRGMAFEERLFQRHRAVMVDHTNTPKEDIKKVFAEAQAGTYLYQLKCSLPESFYADIIHNTTAYRMNNFIPDFLYIYEDPASKIKKIRIIDAKSSKELSKTHQFQVTSYAFFLSYLIKDIRHVEIDEIGGVWLPSNMDEPVTFRIDFVLHKIRYVYLDVLVKVSTTHSQEEQEAEADWTKLSRKGRDIQCPQCKEDASNTLKTLALLDKDPTYPLSMNTKDEKLDMDKLAEILQNLGITNGQQENVVHWAEYYNDCIETYRRKQPKFMGYATVLTAKDVDHDIYIYLQIDPFLQKPFLYGIQVVDTRNPDNEVFEAFYSIDYEKYASKEGDTEERKKAYSDFVDNFIQDLTETLYQMDQLQSRCLFYVYNSQEKKAIQQLLYEIVRSDGDELVTVNAERRNEIITDAMRCLVVLFQDTQLLGLPGIVHFPDMQDVCNTSSVGRSVSIQQLLEQNVVLGVARYQHYKLSDVVEWMTDTVKLDTEVERAGLDLNHVYSFWKGDKEGVSLSNHNANLTSCTTETLILHRFIWLQAILSTYRTLTQQYSAETGMELFPLVCKPFQWPSVQNFNHLLFAKLMFFKQMECIKACDEVRMDRIKDLSHWERQRQQPLLDALAEEGHRSGGLVLELVRMEQLNQYDHRLTFSVSPFLNGPEVQHKLDRLTMDNFRQYILVPDTREGILETIQFSDLMYMNLGKFKKIGIRCVDVEEIHHNELVLCGYRISTRIRRWRLYRRFTNFTTILTINALKNLDQDPRNNDIISLIENPNEWANKNVTDDIHFNSNDTAIQMREAFSMSPSQKTISANLSKKRLQIIWGPPGSGKTEFLALFINWYIKCWKNQVGNTDKNLTIGVTAFTRNAIINLLKRIEKVQHHHGFDDEFSIMYVTEPEWDDTQFGEASNIIDSEWNTSLTVVNRIRRNTPIKIFVIGATVWSWNKMRCKWKTFDKTGCKMMILDESTQLLVPDALLAIACLSKRGKLIIAGDHMQLGPIIKHDYSDITLRLDDPMLFGSIQQCLMRTEDNRAIPMRKFLLQKGAVHDFGPNTLQLKDNWRMNEELNEFFRQVYGPEYTSRFPKIKLHLDLELLEKEEETEDPHLMSHDSSSNNIKKKTDFKLIKSILDPSKPISLVKIVRNSSSSSSMSDFHQDKEAVEKEAEIVQTLIESYLCARIKNVDASQIPANHAKQEPLAMVVVPHHQQRVAIKRRIPHFIPVDTVEKMQGQECDLVIACFSCMNNTGRGKKTNEFLRDFRRWNVALSRARCKVIILTVDELLNPHPMEGLLDSFTHTLEPTDGWALLCLLQDWAQSKNSLWTWVA
ncbi:hypothetical protein BDF20DRAFT_901567 [Mycotypha africana]|uniref:uncharacterized protein n=1 Tax=Mycotypha africana TaxID=64632 RepID=UPI0022FFED27|nr:uncharacterized protein BDF20DRAFT_901567 [Mycotypha africana]KAI8967276.1 hypothetical protein BDF20DRAFT_901567 [Mycotypha africana]